MNIPPDFKEFLQLLEEKKVDYMIVGGYAVAFYGYPRFTKDMDIFYQSTQENIGRLKSALLSFGFSSGDLNETLFNEGAIIKMGLEPVRIDLLNSIDGISYEEAQKGIVRGSYDNLAVTFIGKNDLRKNKKATGRLQDQADVEKLEKASTKGKRHDT